MIQHTGLNKVKTHRIAIRRRDCLKVTVFELFFVKFIGIMSSQKEPILCFAVGVVTTLVATRLWEKRKAIQNRSNGW